MEFSYDLLMNTFPPMNSTNCSMPFAALVLACYFCLGILCGLLLVFYRNKRKEKQQNWWFDKAGRLVFSIQVIIKGTNNLSKHNILGRGRHGSVIYKGELYDGITVAVKRVTTKLAAENELLTCKKSDNVNLIKLLGYSLEGDQTFLVYDYVPHGTLARHLFDWKDQGLKPLEWARRLLIASNVADGLQSLHNLCVHCFVHGNLKTRSILLGKDMHARIGGFGLARGVPEGEAVLTKIDIYCFGVILMELIIGRSLDDETQTQTRWFQETHGNKHALFEAIDPQLHIHTYDDVAFASIRKVAALASRCCAPDPNQRPNIDYVLHVLTSAYY